MIFTDNLLPKGSATAPVTFVIDYIIFACHCTMNRLPFFIFFGIAGLISAGPRTTVSVVHSDGDGYISSRARISNYKETWVQSNGKVITWISFNLKGYKFARTRTCMLALHITAVKRSGICDFHPITSPILASENQVSRKSIRYSDLPLVTVPLDSSYSGQVLFMNVTELAKSGRFYGIVIRSRGNLDASFAAREGTVAPALLCTRDAGDSNPVSWFSSTGAPDRFTGKKGDFIVRTSNGVLYKKSAAGWDSVAVIKATPKRIVHKTPSRRAKKTVHTAPRP